MTTKPELEDLGMDDKEGKDQVPLTMLCSRSQWPASHREDAPSP